MKKLQLRRPNIWTGQSNIVLKQDKLIADQPEYQRLLEDCKDIPFWIKEPHKDIRTCCFNHLIGLPRKDSEKGTEIHPIYDYEYEIMEGIENHQHLWCKKSRGIGFTTFMLRYFAWLALKDETYRDKNIFIITGTKVNFANELKVKIERLFVDNYPNLELNSKFTELVLNKTRFIIFPTKSLKSMRGYTDVAYIFIDEADYFEPKEQEEIGAVIKAYQEKSNCKIIMVSTPHRPDGLFSRIESGESFKGFFYKLELLYWKGLDKIYDRAFIERIKKTDPDFDREYGGKYLGKIGNIFTQQVIDLALYYGDILRERNPNLTPSTFKSHYVGVDYGGGSSKTVAVVVEHDPENNRMDIIHDQEYGRDQTPSEIADDLFDLYLQLGHNTLFLCDGSRPDAINELKIRFNERTDWKKPEDISPTEGVVFPINFRQHHKTMLEWTHILAANGQISLPRQFDKLVIALRTARGREWDLIKDDTVNDDHLDALRLALKGVHSA